MNNDYNFKKKINHFENSIVLFDMKSTEYNTFWKHYFFFKYLYTQKLKHSIVRLHCTLLQKLFKAKITVIKFIIHN